MSPTKTAVVVAALPLVGAATLAAAAGPTPYAPAVDDHPVAVSRDAAVTALTSRAAGTPLAALALTGAPSATPGVVVTMRKTAFGAGSDLLPTWQAATVLGAFGDLTTAGPTATSGVGISSVRFALPGGAVLDPGITLNTGGAAAHQVFGTPARDVVAQRITDVAARRGFTVKSIAFFTGITDNPVVTLVAADRALLTQRSALVAEMFPRPATVEGYYVEVQGPDGTPLTREAAAYRASAFLVWNDPAVEAEAGFVHAGPPAARRSPVPELRGATFITRGKAGPRLRVRVASHGARVVLSGRDVARPAVIAAGRGVTTVTLRLRRPAATVAFTATATRRGLPPSSARWRLSRH